MLDDPHFRIVYYEPDSSKIFPNTDIKGGVVISYHDKTRYFGAIQTFTSFSELNSILLKVNSISTSTPTKLSVLIIFLKNRSTASLRRKLYIGSRGRSYWDSAMKSKSNAIIWCSWTPCHMRKRAHSPQSSTNCSGKANKTI